jgi:hypothetical protein
MINETITQKNDFDNEIYNSETILTAFEHFVDKPIWVAIELIQDKGGETKKIPYNPSSCRENPTKASCTKPETWGTFLECITFINAQQNKKFIPGIALTKDLGLCAIDLDKVAKNKKLEVEEAVTIIKSINSYCEISQSGNGVHLFCFAEKPGDSCKRKLGKWDLEIYNNARFIAVTGNTLGTFRKIQKSQEQLTTLYNTYFNEKKSPQVSDLVTSPPLEDVEILGKLSKKIDRLLNKGERYSSDESGMDQALMNKLVFYSQNKDQIERIFHNSTYYKTKTEQHKTKWSRADYRQRTFDKAINSSTAFYQPKSIHKSLRTPQNPDTQESAEKTLASLGESIKKAARLLLGDENPCKEFAIDEFPEEIQDYVKSISRSTDASPIMIFGSCLSCISAYASRVYVEYIGKLYPNLYQLFLAASGGFKSTALRYGCYFAYENEKSSAMKQRAELAAAAAISNKQDRDKEHYCILTRRALSAKLLPAKTTSERLFRDLSRGKKGLLPLSEFSDWLSSFEANYNKPLKAIFTDLYDCPPFYEVTTCGNELDPIVITDPYISILGFSAPDWLEGQVSDKDVMKGFFSRFLIFYVRERGKKLKAWPEAPFTPSEGFKKVLERIEKCEGEYHFSPEARKHYEAIFDAVQEILAEKQEAHALLEPFTKRWCPSILKVALLLHLAESPNTREIPAKHIRSAAKYIGCAIKSTLHIFKSGLLESEFQRNCTAILKYIAERDGKATRKAILTSRRIKTTKKDDNAKTYDEILEYLIESGQLDVITTAKRNDWIYHLTVEAEESQRSKS